MDMLITTLSVLILIAGMSLLLSSHFIRGILGIILISIAINFILLIAGGLSTKHPPFLNGMAQHHLLANPLPQALILTAIVISFALIIFLVCLVRFYLKTETSNREAL